MHAYHKDTEKRPDTLTSGDHVYNPTSKAWEPVTSAYWSEQNQVFVVNCGPLGHVIHTYGARVKVTARRYY